MLEEPQPVGPRRHRPLLVESEAGGQEVSKLPLLVDRRNDAQAGGGQRAGAVDDFLQHIGQIEA